MYVYVLIINILCSVMYGQIKVLGYIFPMSQVVYQSTGGCDNGLATYIEC